MYLNPDRVAPIYKHVLNPELAATLLIWWQHSEWQVYSVTYQTI